MLPDSEVLPVQLLHLAYHILYQRLAEGNQVRCLIRQVLQFERNLGFQMEDRTLQGDHIGGRSAFIHAKELKVAAEVKNIELVLILTIHQPRAQTGASPDHLPELRLAHDLLEKHQIQHLRHVNAGVQHIHGNGDLRQLLRVRKLIDGALRIGHIVVDDFGETGQVRIFLVEHLKDFLGVDVVLCKDDGFAQFAAIVDGQAIGHQRIQHLPDGIFIENPLVQRRRCNTLRKFPILVLKSVLVSPLVRVGKFIVDNALFNEFQFRFYRQEIHQIPVLDRLRQLIAIGGHTIFQLKNLIGILVNFVFRRGCQPHQRGIKVVENIPVFVVNGAVSFVADDQIEMPAGEEFALLVLYTVDDVVHGLIGGKYAVSGVVILFFAEVGDREIGQQIHKAALGLRYQTVAVSKEENIFHPTMLEQHIA